MKNVNMINNYLSNFIPVLNEFNLSFTILILLSKLFNVISCLFFQNSLFFFSSKIKSFLTIHPTIAFLPYCDLFEFEPCTKN